MNPRRRKTREFIRTELLNEAARLWGYDDTDLALESFDPLVGLLLGSFATGLEQAYQELDNTQSRLVEQLVRLLTPDVFTGPTPAHAVMKTQIIDPSFTVNPSHSFSCQALGSEFFFSPAGTYPLLNAQLKKVLVQDKLREYSGPAKDSFLSQSADTHDYWLGLAVDESLESLDDLLVFIDWRNTPERSQFLAQLPDIKVIGAGVELAMTMGLPDLGNAIINTPASQIAAAVNAEYARHFIRISTRNAVTCTPVSLKSLAGKCPPELEQVLALGDISRYFTTDLVWLKLVFPGTYSADAVYGAYVDINAFPVVNQQQIPRTPPVHPFFTTLPIQTPDGEYYLDMVQVQSPAGKQVLSVQSLTRDEPYWYLVRRGGVARFDERDGYETVRNMVNLLRDENAMFASTGRTDLETDLKSIRETVERLDRHRPKDTTAQTYLTVRIPDTEGQLSISFLTTRADQANKIPAKTPMKRLSGLAFTNEGSEMLTSTIGGKKPLSPDEQLPVFRKALLSRDRIVTNEDVRNFCFAELGDKIKRVDLKKGVQLGNTKLAGLERTIDVCLVPALQLPTDQWAELIHRLECLLRNHSNDLVRYRVLVTA